jgi:N4-gp56 family major capsid protein
MAISNSTQLNDLVGQIVQSEAQSAAYSARVMRNIVHSVQVPQGAGSIVVPRFAKLTPASLTEGTAPSSTTWTSDGVTLTPAERGTYVQISKRVLWADPFGDLAPYGEQLGRALAEDEDDLIIDTIAASGAVSTIVNNQGTAVANTDLADFRTAIATLEAADAPKPYYAVYHPTSWAKLVADLDDASAFASVGQQIVEGFGEGMPSLNGFVGAPYGVPTFISTGVPDDRHGGQPSFVNLMFAKECCGYGYMQDLAVDVDDNVTARAFDLMAWYGGHASVLVAAYGVQIEDDVDG